MRIVYSYQDEEHVKDFDMDEILIGRPREGSVVHLDLTPDFTVSRSHAKIWVENGRFWIEDKNSATGTLVKGQEIKGKGPWQLQPGDAINMGETILRLEIPKNIIDPYATRPDMLPKGPLEDASQTLDANAPAFASIRNAATDYDRRLALFYELPLKFGEETNIGALLQLIVEWVLKAIPVAKRGAVLIRDQRTGRLLLKACLPANHAAVSIKMAQLAIEQRKAFIWPPSSLLYEIDEDTTRSLVDTLVKHGIESAMYAPMVWRGKALGVLCVDNDESQDVFHKDDLMLLQAVVHHAAMAVANLQLQEDWRRQAEIQSNMLKLVSPQIAERLKQQRGRIRLGGEFCEATTLFSDIRGFVNMSANMSPHDVTDMLEDYFSQLVPIVFKYQGTIDKFVGDAILAVFGSPNPDEHQHIHAVTAAMHMQAAMQEVNARRAAHGKRTGELGIGIHCGEVVHGFFGTPERMEFTVIGDAVNRASRYCDGARGGEVLISREVHQWIWNLIEAEQTFIDTKHEGAFAAYRVKGIKE